MDQRDFLAAKEAALRDSGIGTLGEKSVHAVLKAAYEPHGENREVAVGGYVADILGSLGYADPMEKALGFYGPMFLMYSVYDGAEAKDGIIAAADSYLEKTGNRLREEKNI